MSKHLKRWIALMMAACLLMGLMPAALTEEIPAADAEIEAFSEPDAPEAEAADAEIEVYAESVEPEVEIAEDVDLAVGEDAEAMPEDDWAGEAVPAQESASAKPWFYAWTVSARTNVYRDAELSDLICALSADEAVLVVERAGGVVRAAFGGMGGAVEGYIAASDVEALTASEAENLLDEMAVIGDVLLYGDDLDWPLPSPVHGQLLASDFTRYSNDKQFVVQGKTITARMVGDHSDCWSWARALYNIIWGVKFDSTYVGDAKTGYNLIRNIKTDSERLLTGANLKKFLAQAPLGCTLRICSCPLSCSNINKDGCSKHEKHSLMVVARDDKGMVVMDNMTGNGKDKYDTRYYTYDNFAKHWAKYKMIKYIKWPNAPVYDNSAEIAAANIQPESVTLSETSVTVTPANPCKLVATVLPANAANKTVTWSSSDPFVAYADASGNVVVVADGTATLTATTVNGLTASVKVTARQKDIEPTKVTLSASGTVYITRGATLQLKAALSPAGATSTLTWKSSKPSVATVSASGLVTGVKAGTATIAVATANKKAARVTVKVLKPNQAAKVKLDKSGTVTLSLGQTLKLTPTVYPATSTTALKWKSSKKSVAKVSSNGTVTPVKAGTATISVVTSNKKVARVKVKVYDPYKPTKVTLNQSGTVALNLGQTLKLTPTLSPSTAATSYKWKSSNSKIARVASDGTVTPVKAGTVTITVATANKKTAKVKVRVVDPRVPTAVTLNQSGTVTLKVGQTLQLSAAVSPSTATTAYKWKSSDTTVAKVTSNGLVGGIKAGTCTVAVATANGKIAKVTVKVTK